MELFSSGLLGIKIFGMNELLAWVSDNKGKSVSIIFAVIDLFLAFDSMGAYGVYQMFVSLVFILSFIWFGDCWGKIKVFFFIQKETPGIFMEFIGWLLLTTPIFLKIVQYFIYFYKI